MTAVWIILIVAALAVSTILTLIRSTAPVRRHRAELREKKSILTDGMPATAVIDAIEQTNATIGEQPVVRMELIVTDAEGLSWRTVVRTAIPIIRIPQFQEGKRIDVKYIKVNDEVKVEVVGAYVPAF
ncbi:hypothetical protein [Cohnella zeiphila]|uniref:DUF3592 domain-containing protein n=1 Tax=Cohnella zeiphila TaxID=2761120 RepID=A0A7X0SQ72_9BACL|nr:hypothetical protein [Cohnella zeiphila]MBB6734132.1 hypothetical protein [Cohnella zeiphila]